MMKRFLTGFLLLCVTAIGHASDRIVVAGGSLTEILYALGAGDRVVGVDETTSWPSQTASLPRIGYWKQLSTEGILSLHPDMFITWQDAGPTVTLEQLRTQKIKVVTLPRVPATLEQMLTNIQTLGKMLGAEDKASALIADIRQRLGKVKQASADNPPVRAMFILSAGGSAPQVAGKGSVADAILTLAGAQNVATHTQYKGYSAEAILAADPDVIIVTREMVQGDLNRLSTITGITRTAAWKNQRIVTIDQALILGMGPRVADAVESLHQQF